MSSVMMTASPGVPEKMLGVSELNQLAKQLLEKHLSNVLVLGEISGRKWDGSGHCWFAIKDAHSVVACVAFRQVAAQFRDVLQDGQEVLIRGRLTIYPASGKYQLVASHLALYGMGARQQALEQLKKKLTDEGLLTRSKRRLPLLPRRVALITSREGAVLRDIVNIAYRRFAKANLLVVPIKVQGVDCAAQVCAALQRLYQMYQKLQLSVIVVARGGGSFEDLWGFQSEEVVRAIAASPIPVVSAIGHETDVTLCDFAADHRAPTPSAAAELVFPVLSQLLLQLRQNKVRLQSSLQKHLQQQRLTLRVLRAELKEPELLLLSFVQRLAEAQRRLQMAMRNRLRALRQPLTQLQQRLVQRSPQVVLHTLGWRIVQAQQRLRAVHRPLLLGWRESLRRNRARLVRINVQLLRAQRLTLQSVVNRLQALSPLGVLERGYAIVAHADSHCILRDAADASVGDRLRIRLHRGELEAQVGSK